MREAIRRVKCPGCDATFDAEHPGSFMAFAGHYWLHHTFEGRVTRWLRSKFASEGDP